MPYRLLGTEHLNNSFPIFSYSLVSICAPGFALMITSLRDLQNGNEVDAMLFMTRAVTEFCFSAAAVVWVKLCNFMGGEKQIVGLSFC